MGRSVLPARTRLLTALLTAGLLAAAASLSAAAAYRVDVRLLPAEKPSVFLKLDGGLLYVAGSLEELDKAIPIKASSTRFLELAGKTLPGYSFIDVPIPITRDDTSAIKASFHTFHYEVPTDGNGSILAVLAAEFEIARADQRGEMLTYRIRRTIHLDPPDSRGRVAFTDLPDLNHLKLTIENKIKGRTARIGLQLTADAIPIQDVTRKGRTLYAEMTVRDAGGDTVHQAAGDLQKFGFT